MEAKISTYPCDGCKVSLYHCNGCEVRESMMSRVCDPERLEEARQELSAIIHKYRRDKAR